MIKLPLNNNLSTFLATYLGYLDVYEISDTNVIFGSNWRLKPTKDNKSSLTADLSGNTIVFSPTIVEDDNSFWFIKDEEGNYIPKKRLVTSLYQQTSTHLNNIFEFKGCFKEIKLHTNYENLKYSINAFISAYKKDTSGNLILLDEITSDVDVLGDFIIQLDTNPLDNISNLQWGFRISGYPVYPTEEGNQGFVIIDDIN